MTKPFANSQLVLQQMCAVRPVAARVDRGGRGAGRSRSKLLLEGTVKQVLVRRHHLRLLDEVGSQGQERKTAQRFSGRTPIPGSFVRMSQVKNFGQALKTLEKTIFCRRRVNREVQTVN